MIKDSMGILRPHGSSFLRSLYTAKRKWQSDDICVPVLVELVTHHDEQKRRRGRPRKAHPLNTVIAEVSPSEMVKLREQAHIAITGLSPAQIDALKDGLVKLVGFYRVMLQGQSMWKRRIGAGRAPNRHLIWAIHDCGALWERVTGENWRKVRGWTGAGGMTREDHLNRHPPIILVRELIHLATGKQHPQSLDRAWRHARR